jgi:hypothetical protein
MTSEVSATWYFSQKEQLVFSVWIKLHALIQHESPCPVLTPVHGMEYCVGLNKAINHWTNLAWRRFEPRSPKWHNGTLSTTPRAHACKPFWFSNLFSDPLRANSYSYSKHLQLHNSCFDPLKASAQFFV